MLCSTCINKSYNLMPSLKNVQNVKYNCTPNSTDQLKACEMEVLGAIKEALKKVFLGYCV